MGTNNNHVIQSDPVAAYADEAVSLLAHVEAVEDELNALIGDTELTRNAQLADRHREISSSLKVADIYASLAIAEAIDKHLRAREPVTIPRRAQVGYLGGDK